MSFRWIAGLLFALAVFLPETVFSQQLKLTVKSPMGVVFSGQPGDLRVLLGEVDGLGASLNRMGEVHYDPSRRGAFYDISFELITEATGIPFNNGQLIVTRTKAFRGNDIPADALYDADFGVRFGEGADIHLINDIQPYIIRSNLTADKTSTFRKLGIFVSERLSPGRYEAGIVYSFILP